MLVSGNGHSPFHELSPACLAPPEHLFKRHFAKFKCVADESSPLRSHASSCWGAIDAGLLM